MAQVRATKSLAESIGIMANIDATKSKRALEPSKNYRQVCAPTAKPENRI